MSYSDFWNTNYSRQTIIDSFLSDDTTVPVKKEKDLVRLAGYKKAISNFVNIIAGQSVPVTFKGTDSYTDGKKVVLSGNIKESNFDYNCGLAMHEGSHIVYSDFFNREDVEEIIFHTVGKKFSTDRYFTSTVKDICNYIEDRRIDSLVYNSSPGYKGYYKALYAKYFEAKSITKALKTKVYAQENTVSNYMFYIANMTNQWCDSNDLPGLRKIFKMIDLNNVGRLKTTEDCYKLAAIIGKEIFSLVEKAQEEKEEQGNQEGKNGEGNSDSSTEWNGDAFGNSFTDEEFNPKKSPTMSPDSDYSERQEKLIENAIQTQRDFIDGKAKKTGLTKKESNTVKALEKSGASEEIVDVKDDYGHVKNHKVVIFEKITEDLVTSMMVPFLRKTTDYWREMTDEDIADGLRLGTLLGRKLQIRNEEKTLLTTRQGKGKIDKRLIAELGFGNDKVFSHLETSRFKRVNLHLSIDVSGSMSGSKIKNALKSALAIAKASTMTNNIDLQISLRGTMGRGTNKPAVAILYNSKKDSLKHLIKFTQMVDAGGLTPEGLAFDAIKKLILTERAEDNIFVNYSDGMPYSDNYYGQNAVKHTRRVVDDLKYNGFKILSFFISNGYTEDDSTKQDFETMYGKGASFIEPTNVMMVARNLNNMFLGK